MTDTRWPPAPLLPASDARPQLVVVREGDWAAVLHNQQYYMAKRAERRRNGRRRTPEDQAR